MSKQNKRRSRFLLGAAVGAVLVIMAFYWRCSSRGSFGITDGQQAVSLPSSKGEKTQKPAEPPCELRIDSEGLKLDNDPVELKVALDACKKSGKANLFITGGANVGKRENTIATLEQAGIVVERTRK